MIQDIAPHRFDRTYVIGKPDAHDIALCVRKGRVLLQRDGDGWALPRFGTAIPTEDALHVFSLDGVDCYLARTPDAVPEGAEYVASGRCGLWRRPSPPSPPCSSTGGTARGSTAAIAAIR